MQIKYCQMHSLNLGVSLWIAAGAILVLRDDLQLWGGPDMTPAEKLSLAWMDFVAWAKQRKIQCFDDIDVTQTSFTVIMFWRNDVLLNEQEIDDLQRRSQSVVELLPKLSQEGKRSWIIRGTLVQVLEAERLIYEGPQPSVSQKRKRSEDSAEPEHSEPGASK
eukprot:s53_g30.t1